MRVLFLAHAYPRYEHDPVGSFILRLATALRDEGVDVTVLAPAAAGVRPYEVIEGIPVHRFRYAPHRLEQLAYTGTMSQQVRESWGARAALLGMIAAATARAAAIVRRTNIDLIHAHWWFPGGLSGVLAKAATARPLVTTLHGSDVRLLGHMPFGQTLFRLVAERSFALTTVSTWLADRAAQFEPRAKPIVAPMPVASNLFTPGGPRSPDRLLFVGKLSEQKGLHHLLDAMAKMRTTATLDVVGAGRVDDAHLRDLADRLGLSARVRWFPLLTQAELAERYREAAILVIPALEEGLGLTAIEALLSETPVVAFRSGGIPDVVIDQRTGLLVEPGNALGLAAALDQLLESSPLRARLGRDGREYVLATFGPAAVARRYAAIYEAAVARHAAPRP